MSAPLVGPERFAALVATVADPVRRYLWRRTDESQADGVLAATLEVLHQRADDLTDVDPVAWALGVARLHLQSAQRLQRRQVFLAQRIDVAEPPLQHADEHSDVEAAVRLALARVRESDAELLRLWSWEGLTVPGIGVVQAEPADAVALRLDRARREFTELSLSASGGGDDPRTLLRRVDPAGSLPPLAPVELAAHIAAAAGGPGTERPPATSRRRSPWLIAGVGVLSAGAAASLLLPFALGVGGGSTSSFRLYATGGPGAVCSPVTEAALAPAQVAFRAEVSGIDAAVVTLHVLDRYAGEVGDSVTVTQAAESAIDGAPITFENGVDYLLAADGDTILTCGLSGPSSPELTRLYREAFAAR
ncbi:sigma-70 family RNA polymerase sigma factor [Rathayibacter iranicus]|uniref:Sigma-70 family RNA polymerase sigma factor n=2 Tax=Rathayibacter iranicus TaxID=59737 RepID=A0AAD1AEC4_9MICO|nr:sigma-70 family RNA polymerase sigma factor [Rathayibacter iranicus]AZZ57006.1 sigma-70 family RNA polymerase sigma factor [Rathayibacter iranicus]MWV29618.1 hypothetical protein [Rathayibacter iranicus NCPPB 2253 = VKM Ac-1602]PPI41930.1 hypothetical protein C5E09_13690 [Rathayibacter iranicus]PPI57671.1 hypothetical protein C5E08_14590 [Rathayibacter iranicus]PPI68649.1 hypothetical protein C5E01_13645 [Rathayibacter iranicus]